MPVSRCSASKTSLSSFANPSSGSFTSAIDARGQAFGDNTAAYETLDRMEQHLTQDVKLQLDGTKYQLGRKLQIDAASETFIGDSAANELLTRNYRKGFEVPGAGTA